MSWAVELSQLNNHLTWPVPANSLPYASDWMTQNFLPEWLHSRNVDADFDTTDEAWNILAAKVLIKLPKECVCPQGSSLFLFSGRAAVTTAQHLSILPDSVYQKIKRASRKRAGWPEHILQASVLEMSNQLRAWTPTLNADTVGVARLYEWGKF